MLSCLLFSLSFIGLTCLSFILRNGPVSCVAIYKLAANLIEKVFSVKIDKKIIHIHHSYPGFIMILLLEFLGKFTILAAIGWGAVLSDFAFHLIAHFKWGDPLFDFYIYVNDKEA